MNWHHQFVAALSKRARVSVVGAFIFAVSSAAVAQECTCEDDGDWARAGSTLSPKNIGDLVGIGGPPTGSERLFVKGAAGAIRGESESFAVVGASSDGTGVLGDGARVGVHGLNTDGDVSSVGVVGSNTLGTGVSGDSKGGIGVSGDSKSAAGVFGRSESGIGVSGDSTNGAGVFGKSKNSNGVSGATESTAAGVLGINLGTGNGVSGTAPKGTGVQGQSESGAGVLGISNGSHGVSGISASGRGVYGSSDLSAGVVGESQTSVGVGGESQISDGVTGSTKGSEAAGVRGSGPSTGVSGVSDSGIGVVGQSTSGAGLRGFSETGAALSLLSLGGDIIEATPDFRVANNGDVFVNGVQVHSDARSKTEIEPVTKILGRLDQIRAVSFERTGVKKPPDGIAGRRIGVLAQEVQAVFPELVSGWGTGDQIAVDYTGLTAVLLGAVRELQAENARLQAQLGALEQRVLLQER